MTAWVKSFLSQRQLIQHGMKKGLYKFIWVIYRGDTRECSQPPLVWHVTLAAMRLGVVDVGDHEPCDSLARSTNKKLFSNKLFSKLLVSPLVTPNILSYKIPIWPPLRTLDCSDISPGFGLSLLVVLVIAQANQLLRRLHGLPKNWLLLRKLS